MTFKERRQRVTDTHGLLVFLEVTSPAFSGAMRIVNDTRNWISNGTEYIGLPFRFKLPDDASGQVPSSVIEIDNVGRGLSEEIEKIKFDDVVMATIKLSDTANPDHIERTYVIPMAHISISGTTASANCSVDYIMRQQAVKLRYDQHTAPGIF